MRTSIAGMSIKDRFCSKPLKGSGGMTLLEIIIVLAILSVILLISFPKIPYLSDFTLNSEARKLAGLFRYLDESATTKKKYYKVLVFPEKDILEVESSTDGVKFTPDADPTMRSLFLKGGIKIVDLDVAGLGRIDKGEVDLFFNPVYGAEPFVLRLKQDKRTLLLDYNPYSGRVKIIDEDEV